MSTVVNDRAGLKALGEEHLRVKISARVHPATKQFIEDIQGKTGTDNPGRAIDVLALIARKSMQKSGAVSIARKNLPEQEKRVALYARIDPATKEFLDEVQQRVGADNLGRALDKVVSVVRKETRPFDNRGIKIIA